MLPFVTSGEAHHNTFVKLYAALSKLLNRPAAQTLLCSRSGVRPPSLHVTMVCRVVKLSELSTQLSRVVCTLIVCTIYQSLSSRAQTSQHSSHCPRRLGQRCSVLQHVPGQASYGFLKLIWAPGGFQHETLEYSGLHDPIAPNGSKWIWFQDSRPRRSAWSL